MRVIDRAGRRYGLLVAIERLPPRSKKDTNARWICRCDCGNPAVAYGQDLERGKVKSCGCLNAKRIKQHGMANAPEYAIWQAMRQRCENPKAQSWANYGGRGIKVCAKWKKFEQFFADMGPKLRGQSLNRIDNDGDYCKENCEWVGTSVQANNTRRNRVLEFNGERRTLSEWAKWAGLGWFTLRTRLDYYGWSLERALTEPPKHAVVYEYRGKRRTLRQWANKSGVDYETLSSRIRKLNWPIEKALTQPITRKRRSKK